MTDKIVTERPNGTRRVQIQLSDETKTEQSHKNRVNINTIMAKVARGGMVPMNRGTPLYGDFTDVADYHSAKDRIIAAQIAFNELPAELRKQFNHDPANIIDFLNDPENEQEAIDLGLLPGEKSSPPPPPEPAAPVVEAGS